MDQLWRTVQGGGGAAPPPAGAAAAAPPRSQSATFLGANKMPLGGHAAGEPLASAGGRVPPGKLAAKLCNVADQRASAAWDKLQEEIKVQKLVWESVALTKAQAPDRDEKKADIGNLRSRLDEAMSTRQAGDIPGALAILQEVGRPGGKGEALLSRSTFAAVGNVGKQDALLPRRRQLAERVALAASPATLPRGAAEKREIEALVVNCELDDAKLERRIREVLLLAVPAELGAAAAGPKMSGLLGAPVSATGSKKMSQMSQMSDLSFYPVSYAGSRTLSQLAGAPVAPTGSILRGQGATGGGGALQPMQLSAKLGELAEQRVVASWQKLQDEVQVQQLVWESVSLTKAQAPDRHEKAADIARLKVVLGDALGHRQAGDTLAALASLEEVARPNGKGEAHLSRSTYAAVCNVIKQDALQAPRRQLAERVALASVPATLPRTAADKRELEAVVVSCELEDKPLERGIREALLLPMPSALGPPARVQKTGGLGARVSASGSKKMSQMTDASAQPASRAASAMPPSSSEFGPGMAAAHRTGSLGLPPPAPSPARAGAGATAAEEPRFQPKTRIVEAI